MSLMFCLAFIVTSLLWGGVARGDGNHSNLLVEATEDAGAWTCSGTSCSTEYTTDGCLGPSGYCLRVIERRRKQAGITQTVAVTGGSKFLVRGYMRTVQTAGFWNRLHMRATLRSDSERLRSQTMADVNQVRSADGWVLISGDLVTTTETKFVDISVRVRDATVDFDIDNFTMTQIAENVEWREKAERRIEAHRKDDIRLRTKIRNTEVNASELNIQVTQQNSSFPFGVVLNHEEFTDFRYRKYVARVFNTATIKHCLGWEHTERAQVVDVCVQGVVKYGPADHLLNVLKLFRKDVRGSSIVSGRPGHVVSWLKEATPSEIQQNVSARVRSLVEHYGDSFIHWDVNTDQETGDWFERRTNNSEFTQDLFREVASVSRVPLFMNQQGVLSNGRWLQSFVGRYNLYKRNNVPVAGTGLQCHFTTWPDFDILHSRMERLIEGGLDNIWITELLVSDDNVTQRAERLVDVITWLFSYEQVKGVVIRGVRGEHLTRVNAALVDGRQFKENAAGLAFRRLVTATWLSELFSYTPGAADWTETVRGYLGAYRADVYRAGQLINTTEFTLTPGGADVVIEI